MIRRFDSIPDAIKSRYGNGVSILDKRLVHGGDINEAWRLVLSDGSAVFLKTNSPENLDFFVTETAGLEEIAGTDTLSTPELFGLGTDRKEKCSFLLMEYVDSASRNKDYWEEFGRNLALMHRARKDAGTGDYGFDTDNYIGASPQENTRSLSWISFYRDRRLCPQIRRAEDYFSADVLRKLDHLLDHLDSLLREPDHPSLLHGDLWGGNVLPGNDGRAWLIDPAVYYGDPEADLAMTQLFGSFPSSFYGAYHEISPIDPGYRSRRNLYDLYHMLNHLNLFGPAYQNHVLSIVERYQ